MSFLIDRRANARHKNMVNRRRFMERYKKHIKRAVQDAVDERSITDMERGEEVSIPAGDVSEPVTTFAPPRYPSCRHATCAPSRSSVCINKRFCSRTKIPPRKS